MALRHATPFSNHCSNTFVLHLHGFYIRSTRSHFHLLSAHSPLDQTSDSPLISAQTFSSSSWQPLSFASLYSLVVSSQHSSWISCLAVPWSSRYMSIRSYECTTQTPSIAFSAFSAGHALCPWTKGDDAVSFRTRCVNQLRKWSWKSPRYLLACL